MADTALNCREIQLTDRANPARGRFSLRSLFVAILICALLLGLVFKSIECQNLRRALVGIYGNARVDAKIPYGKFRLANPILLKDDNICVCIYRVESQREFFMEIADTPGDGVGVMSSWDGSLGLYSSELVFVFDYFLQASKLKISCQGITYYDVPADFKLNRDFEFRKSAGIYGLEQSIPVFAFDEKTFCIRISDLEKNRN